MERRKKSDPRRLALIGKELDLLRTMNNINLRVEKVTHYLETASCSLTEEAQDLDNFMKDRYSRVKEGLQESKKEFQSINLQRSEMTRLLAGECLGPDQVLEMQRELDPNPNLIKKENILRLIDEHRIAKKRCNYISAILYINLRRCKRELTGLEQEFNSKRKEVIDLSQRNKKPRLSTVVSNTAQSLRSLHELLHIF